jgi:hypothetical protein
MSYRGLETGSTKRMFPPNSDVPTGRRLRYLHYDVRDTVTHSFTGRRLCLGFRAHPFLKFSVAEFLFI